MDTDAYLLLKKLNVRPTPIALYTEYHSVISNYRNEHIILQENYILITMDGIAIFLKLDGIPPLVCGVA